MACGTKRGGMRQTMRILVIILVLMCGQMFWPARAYGDRPIIGVFVPVVSCEVDTDDDGIVDCEEDLDQDGVWDAEDGETDPKKADTDDDGLIDGEEGDRDGDGELGPDESDPLEFDTDGDGVIDGDERREGTKRNTCDTDEDGLSDGVELGFIQPEEIDGCHGLMAAGSNYKNQNEMDPLNPDSDGDGLEDGEEDQNGNGWLDPDETDPSDVDTDGDDLEDGVEALGDYDGDGIPDFDYLTVQGEGECMPPEGIDDLDCDGVPNARDDDSDNDGCPDAQEGGWIDANTDGIPDVYDNEASLCPEPDVANPGAGGGGGEEDLPGDIGSGPTFYSDGGACTLTPGRAGQAGPMSMVMISLIILLFSTARPLIRQIS